MKSLRPIDMARLRGMKAFLFAAMWVVAATVIALNMAASYNRVPLSTMLLLVLAGVASAHMAVRQLEKGGLMFYKSGLGKPRTADCMKENTVYLLLLCGLVNKTWWCVVAENEHFDPFLVVLLDEPVLSETSNQFTVSFDGRNVNIHQGESLAHTVRWR